MEQGNPFTAKAEKAWQQYERLSGTTAADRAMAESFPLGPGFCVPQGVDASVTRAVKAVAALKNARILSAKARAFDRGEINRQGRAK